MPSKPNHSLTDLEHDSASLRETRLKSFLVEPSSQGNTLIRLALDKPAATSAVGGSRSQSGEPRVDIVNKNNRAPKDTKATDTACKAAHNPSSAANN